MPGLGSVLISLQHVRPLLTGEAGGLWSLGAAPPCLNTSYLAGPTPFSIKTPPGGLAFESTNEEKMRKEVWEKELLTKALAKEREEGGKEIKGKYKKK